MRQGSEPFILELSLSSKISRVHLELLGAAPLAAGLEPLGTASHAVLLKLLDAAPFAAGLELLGAGSHAALLDLLGPAAAML